MRVTQSMIANQTLRHIQSNYNNISKYQNQLNTGKKFSRASEDPLSATSGMHYRTQVREIEQFQRNLSSAHTWMETSDQALYDVNTSLQRMRELTSQAANDTYDSEQRKAAAEEIGQLIDHIKDLGNTKVNNKYIFNGTDTENRPIDKSKFDITVEDPNAPPDGTMLFYEGVLYEFTDGSYQEHGIDPEDEGRTPGEIDVSKAVFFESGAISINEDDVELQMMKGVNMPINANGADIFGYEAFGELILLERSMKNADSGTEIGAHLDVLDQQLDRVLSAEANIGARQNRIMMTENRMDQQLITATRIMSDNEDVDFAEAIIQLVSHESILNASLSAGARIMQPSLIDFLR
ncbi:flagellar hook-associated protein FlgL [Geomicrobium sp. JCM 19038]|uniref:flagellar hook-associated protein FlgL n=1 Tax=Geomicrobium sp. JCM 19038 TaxID=1460635 RepID=UPI00045F14C2|nr:flagellar hook-associated protein FlgL [Geomicrobium sp. JCM 19038]GAK07219.1 flagellar hook-associated protein FlgL [Geomicrobium sp. JCM 19038]